jgi:hypothetical protein
MTGYDGSSHYPFFFTGARLIRELADKADPFIKRRLMDLAESYDARLARPSRATVTLLSNGSEIEHAADADAFRAGPRDQWPCLEVNPDPDQDNR